MLYTDACAARSWSDAAFRAAPNSLPASGYPALNQPIIVYGYDTPLSGPTNTLAK